MIDHLKLHVADPVLSRAFYVAALAPLGYRVLLEPAPGVVGLGKDRPDLWLAPVEGETTVCHIAFRADSEHEVQRFHEAATDAGGADNGRPGLRPQYHQNYYSAFVHDPDGNNVEAVYHGLMQPY